MSFKHTRRATSRTERRSDGSEIVERSEEETYEEREGPRSLSLPGQARLVGKGLSTVRRLVRRGLGAIGAALFIGVIRELVGRLVQHLG